MWALVEYKGYQFHVEEGKEIIVPLLHEREGSEIEIEKVLMLRKNDEIVVGTPYVDGVRVKAKVLEHIKLPKVIVFKYRPKKNYRRKKGHRQRATRLKVLKIEY